MCDHFYKKATIWSPLLFLSPSNQETHRAGRLAAPPFTAGLPL